MRLLRFCGLGIPSLREGWRTSLQPLNDVILGCRRRRRFIPARAWRPLPVRCWSVAVASAVADCYQPRVVAASNTSTSTSTAPPPPPPPAAAVLEDDCSRPPVAHVVAGV